MSSGCSTPHRELLDHRLIPCTWGSPALVHCKTAVELLPFLDPFVVHAEFQRGFCIDQLQVHLAVIQLTPLDVCVLEYRLAVITERLASTKAIGPVTMSISAVDAVLILKHQRYDEAGGGLILAAHQRGQPARTHEDVVVHTDRKLVVAS